MLQSRSLYRDSHPLQTVNSTSQFIIISKLAKDTFDSHIQITDNGEQKWPHCWVLGNTHSDYPPVKSIITIKNWDKKSPFLIPICFVIVFIKYQSSIFFRPIVEILKSFFSCLIPYWLVSTQIGFFSFLPINVNSSSTASLWILILFPEIFFFPPQVPRVDPCSTKLVFCPTCTAQLPPIVLLKDAS